MATQYGSPSFSSSSGIQSSKYDVFLSFADDTRRKFTCHLYRALSRKGIKTFIDSDQKKQKKTFRDPDLLKGKNLLPETIQAIEESRACIIVFSANYASSSRCLEELVQILQCKQSKGTLIFPIFYEVDPSDVRNQRGSFGDAHEKRFGDDMQMINRWRSAPKEATSFSGWVSRNYGDDAQFLHRIVEHISFDVLDRSYLDVAKYPVGIESRVQDVVELVGVGGDHVGIESRVQDVVELVGVGGDHVGIESRVQDVVVGVGGDDVRMIGIWGTGGIGKTTIAKAVYSSIVHKFESSCFLVNVRESSVSYEGLLGVLNKLISVVLRGSKFKLNSVDEGIRVIRKALRRKKVLLVLDDVNESNQLEILAGECNWFGFGSRVIITTRDKRLLVAHQVKHIYKVRELDQDQALELFSLHAFNRKTPQNGYEELARYVIQYAQGLPLALVNLGRGLCGRTVEEWQEAKCSNWKFYNREVHKTLKVSYDALDDSMREVFLDIACFFTGKNKNYVAQILDGGDLYPMFSIPVLLEKAFLEINEENHILMGNVLQQMAEEIVHSESPNDPSQRSRLWFPDDVYHVLTKGSGTDKIKGIMVKLSEPNEIVLSPTSFSGMKNLRYFINCNASFSGEVIDYLPNELRLIDWHDFPFESFPSNFIPEKLVRLHMPRSRLSRLGKRFKLSKSLKYVNLESSPLLTEIPDLSGFPDLEEVNVNNCTSLVEVADSNGFLDKLVALSLWGCNNLTVFPRKIALKSVEYINLRGCRMLETFPEIVGKMEFLTSLDLSGTAIKKLPSSIAHLSSLEELTIRECENLTELPCSIFELQHLWCLDLQDCSKLVTIPKWSAESVTPESPDLCYLNLRGCNMLQEIPELPPKVNWVNAADCTSLERFAKLSNILEHKDSHMIKCITLLNCQKLCQSLAHGVTDDEHILADEICFRFLSCRQSEFDVVFPGIAAPKWFNHHEVLEELVDPPDLSFKIPQNCTQGNIGLAICAAASTVEEINLEEVTQNTCSFSVRIDIGAESIVTRSFNFEAEDMRSAHVWLLYIPFIKFAYSKSPPFSCRVRLGHTSQGKVRCRSYGVHLVTPEAESEDEDDEMEYDSSNVDDESDEDMKNESDEDMKRSSTSGMKMTRSFLRII